MSVPFVDLSAIHDPIRAELLAAVEGVITADRYILGPEVEAFEREVASSRYSPPPHVVAHAPRAASWALPVGQVTRRARRGEGAESDAKDKSDAGGCA